MIEIKAYGEIKNGQFWPRNSGRYLQQMKDAGNVNQVLLTIKGANIRTLDQNAYAWVVCTSIATRLRQDGWQYTPGNIYKAIEDEHCWEQTINEKTGKIREVLVPLKEQPTDRFHEIIEQVRVGHMQNFPDNYIETPAEHYGLTEQAYDLWKLGKINFVEAKKMSNKKMNH